MRLTLACIDPGYKHLGIRFEIREDNQIIESYNYSYEFNSDAYQLCTNLTNIIKQRNKLFTKCDYILIEKQPNKKIILCKIEFGLECLLTTMYPDSEVVCVNNKDKYIYNGIDTLHQTRYTKKQILGPEYAIRICERYNDISTITKLEESKKKDEIADTVLMIEAYLIKYKHIEQYNEPIYSLMTVPELKVCMKSKGLKVSRKKKSQMIDELESLSF